MAQPGKKNLIGLMVSEGLISFVKIDRSVFKKTPKERIEVQHIKNAHQRDIKRLGADPRKTFNPPGLKL